MACDVTANDNIKRLLQSSCAEFGSVETLVNCAGRTKRMPTLDFSRSRVECDHQNELERHSARLSSILPYPEVRRDAAAGGEGRLPCR
jgi:NAD(P)-dependent dehydrogenase (short-subunit alcohol dehydrogenase family)